LRRNNDTRAALAEVTAAAHAREQAKERFLAAISHAHAVGASYREIGAAANLSHQRVAQILQQTRPKR
jgi:hypothetical protein